MCRWLRHIAPFLDRVLIHSLCIIAHGVHQHGISTVRVVQASTRKRAKGLRDLNTLLAVEGLEDVLGYRVNSQRPIVALAAALAASLPFAVA